MIERGCVRPVAAEIEGLLPLDMFLNGKRNYVQGSQILARTAELVLSTFGSPLNLTEFAFKHTTTKLVGVSLIEDSATTEREGNGACCRRRAVSVG